MTALSDYLTDIRDGRNIDQRVEAARNAGHDINRATVYSALKGKHAKAPSEDVLQALAFVFEVEVTELRPLVGRPSGELGPWRPTGEAAQLNQYQRDALDNLIKAIVRGGGAHGDATATNEPDSGPGNVLDLPSAPDSLSEVADTVPAAAESGELEGPGEDSI